MNERSDFQLTKLTVRLRNAKTSGIIGSGIIYYAENLKDKIYILTAAHNLFEDGDQFRVLIPEVSIDIYCPAKNDYETISHQVNPEMISPDEDYDMAVLVIDKMVVEEILGSTPHIQCSKERGSTSTFVVKGFPNATQGQELVKINPIWLQNMPVVEKFQLQLNEDYSSWATGGFSGSGIFLEKNNELYLYGIFTRYRAEEKGKVIYCQFIDLANEILENNFLPSIAFTFFNDMGLTFDFFDMHIESAIKNLGPRFNEKLNFRLPIAFLFNDLAKDAIFKRRVIKVFDDWLSSKNSGTTLTDSPLLSEIQSEYQTMREKVFSDLPHVKWKSDEKIDFDEVTSIVQAFIEKCSSKQNELYDLRHAQLEKDKDKVKDHSYTYPYERELYSVRAFIKSHEEFLYNLDEVHVALSNRPCILIKGEAGSGKSHLLGDIAKERNDKHLPTILLLGQLFQKGQGVWQNVLGQLGLTCSKDELLKSLNEIGRQINSRVLILLDALNEGNGKELWPNELSGFINDILRYPFIGLALTVRTTYYNAVISKDLKPGDDFVEINHEGFKGNEYEALSLFCSYYELEQPNFPIMSPEFSSPLFLQLICNGLKESGQKKFPHGYQGISSIFSLYLDAIYSKLSGKREEYRLRKEVIKSAVYEMAKACFEEKRSKRLPLDKAVSLFDEKFPAFRHLLDDLLLESVFIQNIIHDYESETDIEVIYFAYERFGDFYMATKLLEPFQTAQDVKKTFEKDGVLGKLLDKVFWSNNGILEAMSVLLPEKFNLEIIEVFDWVFESQDDNYLGNIDEWLNHFLIDSFKWRQIRSIDDKKITAWLNSGKFNIDDHTWFNLLIELSAQKDHPFNSNRLTRILKQYNMPERDSFWQQFVRFYSSTIDTDIASPIRRLIDWSWQKEISKKIDYETAVLTAQSLAWVLSSTFISLRDQTTKAMVNLLEEQPKALIKILEEFRSVEDMYIQDRLYAVAYGCSLRTTHKNSLKIISQYVYDSIFKGGNPPTHVLIRDYARNIIEYALYRKLEIEINVDLIRPPYKSVLPEKYPSQEDMKTYEIDPNTENYKQEYGRVYGQIKFSVMSWDFGRYTIESAFRDFCPVSFTIEKKCKEFIALLEPKKKKALKYYESLLKIKSTYDVKKGIVSFHHGEEHAKSMEDMINDEIKRQVSVIKRVWDEEQFQFFENVINEHLLSKEKLRESTYKAFDSEKIKRWVTKRAYDLGYNAKTHGHYDASISNFNDRSDNKIERIGKKYQWIAFYEIVAIVADNYKIKADRWNGKANYNFYAGPWHGYLRNIDPAFTTKNKETDDDDNIQDVESLSQNWWTPEKYTYWIPEGSKWINTTKDLPDPRHIIQKKDDEGVEWLYLKTNIHWREPKKVGRDRYSFQRKEIWYLLQAYIIKKRDKEKMKKYLNEENFWGRWMPESHKSNLSGFNRENYWSPAAKENEKETWQKLGGTNYKVMVTTTEAVGELSQDKSRAHFRYEMPCQLIFDGMNLEYGEKDGEFVIDEGETVVINPDYSAILMRKDYFMKFLESQNLDIIWCILGEKNALTGTFANEGDNFFKVINGVYSIDGNSITGTLRLSDRE